MDRTDYDNGFALCRWWPKDGLWHIALPAPERGPHRYWQDAEFLTRVEAVAKADEIKARESA